ncbi:E3 ubiquitin-protein ligase RNF12-B-like [Cucurbita moschata]|uniref:E3 ubiquitin-protein ligase RNF12-B-like n=1 Tax=Cucurbita moschata TaxID=3662 RepID=A0A6J1EEJ7_CUCMO|nr:E3 ubiquitin-protein ligase RNF12-B-like [Cucurbita moschata]
MPHRGRRKVRRGRGRPPIRRGGRGEADRSSSQEGSTTGPYAFIPPPEYAPPPQTIPPPENAPPPQTVPPPENAPPPQTTPQAGLDPATRFAPSLADTEEKQTEKFVLGLNPKTRRMLEAFNPKTNEEALRTAKALEEPPEEKKMEPTVVTGRKRPIEVETTKLQPPLQDLDIRVGYLLHPQ